MDFADDAKLPKLAVLHYDACTDAADSEEPPELVRKLLDKAGTMAGSRTYKNNVLFLVPDQDYTERMADLVQRHLAIRRIVGDTGCRAQFSDEQKKRLKEMDESAVL